MQTHNQELEGKIYLITRTAIGIGEETITFLFTQQGQFYLSSSKVQKTLR